MGGQGSEDLVEVAVLQVAAGNGRQVAKLSQRDLRADGGNAVDGIRGPHQ